MDFVLNDKDSTVNTLVNSFGAGPFGVLVLGLKKQFYVESCPLDIKDSVWCGVEICRDYANPLN